MPVDRAFILGDDGDLDQQAAYTALSRGRIENRLYMLEPDEDLQQLLDDTPERMPLIAHAEHELARDRSQPRATDFAGSYAAELLAALPEPEGPPVTGRAADLLANLPEPVGRPARRALADELLASLPDPVDDHASQVDDITARLDRLQHRRTPELDDGLGIDPW